MADAEKTLTILDFRQEMIDKHGEPNLGDWFSKVMAELEEAGIDDEGERRAIVRAMVRYTG